MFNTSPDHLPHNKTLKIKQDDKFFTRLLSKENSVTNPSFRVYYGGLPGAVPFMWESQPGTPKSTFSDTSLPPLTPPPAYYSKSKSKPIKNKHSRSGLLQALFPKRSRFSTPDDDEENAANIGSPTSILCFDIGKW